MTTTTIGCVSYRRSTAEPRGRWARWLQQMRKDRGWSQTQAFEALREGLGLGSKSRASYYAIDMGTRIPKPYQAEFLIKYYGSSPDDIPEPTEEEDPLTLALNAQTEAIVALVEELRASRAEQVGTTEGFAALAARVVDTLEAREGKR